MSAPILPLATWASGTNQNSIPANDNALRLEALSRRIISKTTTAQPGSPADGDCYIIPTGKTGAQWTLFTVGDIALYRGGTWIAWAPVTGIVVNVNGTPEAWNSGWAPDGYLDGSATYDPPSIAAGATATTTVTVTGAALGDFADASFSLTLAGLAMTAYVSATNTVTAVLFNPTAGAIDLASGTIRARVRKA